MIAAGSLVRFRSDAPGRHRRGPSDVYTVLQVENPGDDIDSIYTELMALVLHPSGTTTWEYIHNLTPLDCN